MKDYIKPTFVLAGLAPVALSAMNCDVKLKGEDLETLYVAFDIAQSDYGNIFALSEGCDIGIPDEMALYCKFTSNADAVGLAFTS